MTGLLFRPIVLLALLALTVSLAGCSAAQPASGVITGQAVVTYASDSSGVLLLIDDSKAYRPLTFPAASLRDGLEVWFEGTPHIAASDTTAVPLTLQRLLHLHQQTAFTVEQSEGTSFVLVGLNGQQYRPLAPLPLAYAQDGLAVNAEIRLQPDSLNGSSSAEFPTEVLALAFADTTLRAVTARVSHQEIEGGFWGLVGPRGEKWLPRVSLPPAARRDGASVYLVYRIVPPRFGIEQWGTPIELVALHRLD